MKRFLPFAFVLALVLPMISPAPADAQFGLAVGANFTELDDIDFGDRRTTLDNSTGWHAHLWVDVPLGPVALRPGIRYFRAGKLFEDALDDLPTEFDDATASMIEIPLDIRYRFTLPVLTPYLMAGPVLRFPAISDDSERFRTFSLAGGAGVGLEVALGGLRLFPELKYTFGITRFTDDSYEIGGITIEPDNEQRLNAVMLTLGIGL